MSTKLDQAHRDWDRLCAAASIVPAFPITCSNPSPGGITILSRKPLRGC